MHHNDPANKEISKRVGVKASYNLSDILSDCGEYLDNGPLVYLNPFFYIVDIMLFLQMPQR
jgi:hypothetical protein